MEDKDIRMYMAVRVECNDDHSVEAMGVYLGHIGTVIAVPTHRDEHLFLVLFPEPSKGCNNWWYRAQSLSPADVCPELAYSLAEYARRAMRDCGVGHDIICPKDQLEEQEVL